MERLSSKSGMMEYLLIVLGTLLMAISINVIYEPMAMVTGGITGFSIVIKHMTQGLVEGGIPIWLSNLILNIPLFVMAIRIKGLKFVKKTLFATLCLTVALYIVPSLNIEHQDFLLSSVFGGIIGGTGLGLVFVTTATTGGTDLLTMIIHEKFKHYTVAELLMGIDGVIVLAGAIVFGLNKALYAVIAVYITTKTIDNILEGLKFAKLAFIISNSYDEIAQEIMVELDRGITGLHATGMYLNQDKKMLFCVVSKKEIVNLKEIVAKKDPNAFVIVSDVREVLGEGFIEYRQ